MITENDRATIVETFTIKYSTKILTAVNKKGLVNRYGKKYSNKSINDIVNAKTENLLIEKIIFQLIKKTNLEKQKLNEFKQSITKHSA